LVVNLRNIKFLILGQQLIMMHLFPMVIPVYGVLTMLNIMELLTTDLVYAEIELYNKYYPVSVSQANTMKAELELGSVNPLLFTKMLTNNYINTDDDTDGVYAGTAHYMKQYGKQFQDYMRPEMPNTIGLKYYNEPTCKTLVPKKVVDIITSNQLNGAGYDADGVKGDPISTINHISKIKFLDEVQDIEDVVCKYNIPMASAPIGVVITDKGPLGPGQLCKTDDIGIFGAFTLRSMSKPPAVRDEKFNNFVAFSKAQIDDWVDSVDVSGLIEKDPVSAFKDNYKGKRSSKWIKSVAEKYTEIKSRPLNYFKEKNNSCFVKMENSFKSTDGIDSIKPRLIMTMNMEFLVEFCQFVRLIDRWNDGNFKIHQVKHMTPQEACEKVIAMQRGRHFVTDFTSFESSIDDDILELERYAVRRLCDRANFQNTKRSYDKYAGGPRVLKTKKMDLNIATRNSGDITTSFGNGLVSACIFKYASHMMGETFKFLGEGDDGITDLLDKSKDGKTALDIIDELNFQISSEVTGTKPGDTDFLSKRWHESGSLMLNVGKCLNSLWVKDKEHLKFSKKMHILRCMGLSLHHMSPGHPVLFALVLRIGHETRHYKKHFKNWESHLDWSVFVHNDGPYPNEIAVNEELRGPIAEGAIGFPPIPIIIQEQLEKVFLTPGPMYISSILSEYPAVKSYEASQNFEPLSSKPRCSNSLFELLMFIKEHTE